MKASPVVMDTLTILCPPTRLMAWLRKVFDAKHGKGEEVPPEFERWLRRWVAIRDGLTTEISVLTPDEWQAIRDYLDDT